MLTSFHISQTVDDSDDSEEDYDDLTDGDGADGEGIKTSKASDATTSTKTITIGGSEQTLLTDAGWTDDTAPPTRDLTTRSMPPDLNRIGTQVVELNFNDSMEFPDMDDTPVARASKIDKVMRNSEGRILRKSSTEPNLFTPRFSDAAKKSVTFSKQTLEVKADEADESEDAVPNPSTDVEEAQRQVRAMIHDYGDDFADTLLTLWSEHNNMIEVNKIEERASIIPTKFLETKHETKENLTPFEQLTRSATMFNSSYELNCDSLGSQESNLVFATKFQSMEAMINNMSDAKRTQFALKNTVRDKSRKTVISLLKAHNTNHQPKQWGLAGISELTTTHATTLKKENSECSYTKIKTSHIKPSMSYLNLHQSEDLVDADEPMTDEERRIRFTKKPRPETKKHSAKEGKSKP